MALLIFRNADRTHPGEVVFVKKWPPPSFRDLLDECARCCRPMVGPAEGLLTADLAPVRSLEEISPGAVYLLKGAEMLNPPPMLFKHQADPSSTSFSKVNKAKCAVQALHKVQPRSRGSPPSLSRPQSRSSPMSLSRPQSQGSLHSQGSLRWTSGRASPDSPKSAADSTMTVTVQGPFLGSPPIAWLSEAEMAAPRRPAKWQASDRIGMILSHGGLIRDSSHKDFSNWTRVLDSPDRSLHDRSWQGN